MAPPTDDHENSDSLAVQDETEEQIALISEQLTRVLFGDYSAVVTLEDSGSKWGNLAMHINVAINAARNAIERAEESERIAARARDEALSAARAEAQFLANVSHELRTPLASIRAAAEILDVYTDEPVELRKEFTDIILSESVRLTRLIENVLDLGRIQARQTHWDFEELRVGDTVAEVVRNLDVAKFEHGVNIHLTSDEILPVQYGDRDRLKQLWTNLIGNAIKFNGDSDRVWVSVVNCDGDAVRVEVRDEGQGIPEQDQKIIFDRFRQSTSDTLTNKPGGTGLGLSISKEIVDFHAGEIGVESEVGKGSLFWVKLPVTQEGELNLFQKRLEREALQQ